MHTITTTTAVLFEVADTLVVCDPCYMDKDDGETFAEIRATGSLSRGGICFDDAAGTWRAEVETSNEGSWGERVATLTLSRAGHFPVGAAKHMGTAGVDSGQMCGICSTCLPLDYDALLVKQAENDFTSDLIGFTEGAVSSTGYGDGCYGVTARYDRGGYLAEVVVTFIGDEDDEGEDWDDDEDEDGDDA